MFIIIWPIYKKTVIITSSIVRVSCSGVEISSRPAQEQFWVGFLTTVCSGVLGFIAHTLPDRAIVTPICFFWAIGLHTPMLTELLPEERNNTGFHLLSKYM